MKQFILIIIITITTMFLGKANNELDFRYPKKVLKESIKQLETGNKEMDYPKMIDATIKISLAQSMLSNNNAQKIVDSVDSLAYKTNDIGAKGLLFTLEAKILQSYYNEYAYKFYGRDAIAGEAPKEIENWTRQNFIDKTVQLANIIYSNRYELSQIPIQDYSQVISNAKGCTLVPTLYDFLAHEFIEFLQGYDYTPIIPIFRISNFEVFLSNHPKFVTDTDGIIHLLFKSLLENNADKPASFIYTEIKRLDYEAKNSCQNYNIRLQQKCEALNVLYERFKNNEAIVEVVNEMVRIDNSPKTYELAKDALAKYPNYVNSGVTRDFINKYEQRNIVCRFPKMIIPGKPIDIKIENKNATNVTITAYKIPKNYSWAPYYIKSKDVKKFEEVTSKTYQLETETGNFVNTTVQFPPLEIGKYVFLCSFVDKNGDTLYPENIYQQNMVSVSHINFFGIKIGSEYRIYVIDAETSQPINKAKIISRLSGQYPLETNELGYAVYPYNDKSNEVYVKVGKDSTLSKNIYLRPSRNWNSAKEVAQIYTDRGLYRPGETLKFSVVAYYNDENEPYCCKDKHVVMLLKNANNSTVAEKTLITDQYGRADYTFTIPADGLTGMYTIKAEDKFGSSLGQKDITVSEYKAPTFEIKVDKKSSNLTDSINAEIKGNVRTFSDFPIANATVKYKLTQVRFFPFSDNSDFQYNGTTKTDGQGNWIIPIPKELFNGEKNLAINLDISVTSDSGETQSAFEFFTVGNIKRIQFTGYHKDGLVLEVSKNTILPFKIEDAKGEEIFEECAFTLTNITNDTIAKGVLSSKDKSVDFTTVPSGEYTLHLSLPEEDNTQVEQKVILYRKDDALPPVDTPLWITEKEVACNADGQFSLSMGSSFDTHIYYVIHNNDKITDEGWIRLDKGMHLHNFNITFSDKKNGHITLYAWKDFKLNKKEIQLTNPLPKVKLQFKMESFRDKINPTTNEIWKIRLCDQNGKPYKGAMIATLYDAALDKIAQNYFSNFKFVRKYFQIDFEQLSKWEEISTQISSDFKYWTNGRLEIPYFNTYLHKFFSQDSFGRILMKCETSPRCNSFHIMGKPRIKLDCCSPEMEEENDDCLETTENNPKEKADSVILRDPNLKNAFFMPRLLSDEDGLFTLEFEVPNRNTQWHLMTIAYTEDLKDCLFEKLVTANKTIMVQPNLPRFLRNGDQSILQSSVMNNSDNEITANVKIQLFNTTDNTIIKENEKVLTLPAKASETVEIEFDTPNDLEEVGFKIIAQNELSSDGEQSIIKIRPASETVIEANPFYLNNEFSEIGLPKFNKSGKITLEYCDNPVWYCVTSLPSAMSQAETVHAYLHNYYATVMAEKIVALNPQVAKAIDYFSHNKVKSNLDKNQDLKLLDINSTTWVQEMQQDNELLENIGELIDSASIQKRKEHTLKKLHALQYPNGEFVWFNGSEPSEYTTMDVLERMGELKELGYLDNGKNMRQMIESAVNSLDSAMISDVEKVTDKKSIYPLFSHYIYIRSLHRDIPMDKKATKIKDKVLKYLKKNWGDFSIREKADIAVTLANYGEFETAEKIIESIMQFSVLSNTLGRYWDVETYDKIGIAVSVLKAAYKIAPQREEIEEIRKWLLLTKETQDWNNVSEKMGAIYAILMTGQNMLYENTVPPVIKIGDLKLTPEGDDKYFGYIKCELPASILESNKITITRNQDTPSWGAVYCQYNAPMDEIGTYRQDNFKVEKEFYRYNKQNILESINENDIKTGDKIQVRLNIKSSRELDYVTIVDQRAACFEPVSQVSFYDYCDGAFYYKETRDEKTNFFINRLRKGNYILKYDVYVNNSGKYCSGTTSAQCLYAPQITGHSAGRIIETK